MRVAESLIPSLKHPPTEITSMGPQHESCGKACMRDAHAIQAYFNGAAT